MKQDLAKFAIFGIELMIIRLILVDTIIENIVPMITWWEQDIAALILFAIWSKIYWGITYQQIKEFFAYKDEAKEKTTE